MKKLISFLLTGLMAFSAVSAGAVSASAATTDNEPAAVSFSAGNDIVFDNSQTQWPKVYLYSWGMGYFGDFVEMTSTGNDLYTAVAPVNVEAGTECFLFTSTTDWSGKQTPNIVTEADKNTYKPIVDEAGNVTSVEQSKTASSTTPKVVATPNSKSFSGSLDVNLYAFNTEDATYTVNNGTADILDAKETLTLTTTSVVKIYIDGALSKTYTYDCVTVADAVINVTPKYLDGVAYTGDLYVYTFGGDRVGAEFNPMVQNADGTYTYTINGSAQVIFTTTNDWATATKFIISDAEGVLDNQEPLVTSGTTAYTLTLPVASPAAPTEPAE